jgi:hypothetical protein
MALLQLYSINVKRSSPDGNTSLMHRSLRALMAATIFALPLLTSCDKIKEKFRAGPDLRWSADSALLANRPKVIFRLVPDGDTAMLIAPIATMGTQGVRPLHMAGRGWRAFDLEFLQSTSTIHAIRFGKVVDAFEARRGYWEPVPIDTAFRCQGGSPIPWGFARVNDRSVRLASNAVPTPLKYPAQLSPAELDEAIEAIPLIIAPSVAGISSSLLPRYERRVYQVPSASGPNPTVVVTYDDPEITPDSVVSFGERPRHFIVVLDKGEYGYKPSWTYKSLGNPRRDVHRLTFLDYMDTNGDGLAELFFGLRDAPSNRFTMIMRFETDAWRETLTYRGQFCE